MAVTAVLPAPPSEAAAAAASTRAAALPRIMPANASATAAAVDWYDLLRRLPGVALLGDAASARQLLVWQQKQRRECHGKEAVLQLECRRTCMDVVALSDTFAPGQAGLEEAALEWLSVLDD